MVIQYRKLTAKDLDTFIEMRICADYRGRRLASECLEYAKQIAQHRNCYKMMLLTGSREKATLDFYRSAGYNSTDKTAFIQWLGM